MKIPRTIKYLCVRSNFYKKGKIKEFILKDITFHILIFLVSRYCSLFLLVYFTPFSKSSIKEICNSSITRSVKDLVSVSKLHNKNQLTIWFLYQREVTVFTCILHFSFISDFPVEYDIVKFKKDRDPWCEGVSNKIFPDIIPFLSPPYLLSRRLVPFSLFFLDFTSTPRLNLRFHMKAPSTILETKFFRHHDFPLFI